jgi:hypothetical protein
MDDEAKAIDNVVDRLAQRFPHVPRPSIEQTVREEHKALDGGRIRDYVPVLVEHAAKARLSRSARSQPAR